MASIQTLHFLFFFNNVASKWMKTKALPLITQHLLLHTQWTIYFFLPTWLSLLFLSKAEISKYSSLLQSWITESWTSVRISICPILSQTKSRWKLFWVAFSFFPLSQDWFAMSSLFMAPFYLLLPTASAILCWKGLGRQEEQPQTGYSWIRGSWVCRRNGDVAKHLQRDFPIFLDWKGKGRDELSDLENSINVM